LVDALGDPVEMLLFLDRVFGELLFDGFARDAPRRDRVEAIPKNADDLGRDRLVEEAYCRLDVPTIVGRDGPLFQVLARTLADGFDGRRKLARVRHGNHTGSYGAGGGTVNPCLRHFNVTLRFPRRPLGYV
jgi:hypothetical protein